MTAIQYATSRLPAWITRATRLSALASSAFPLWSLAALLGAALCLAGQTILGDGDTYTHVAAGLWMLDHGAALTTDPFSYTFAGAPWVAHEWLAELLMGTAYRTAGWPGVVTLFAVASGLTLANLARHLGRWLDPLPVFLMLVVVVPTLMPSLHARPHLLALPIVELWTARLLIARERHTVPWAILPLMALWVNLHGGFMFGIALACPFAAEAVFAAGPAWFPAARRWTIFLAATTAFAMLSPQGWHGFLFPFQLLQMKELQHIQEWQPADFSQFNPIELALVTALYVCLTRGVRVPAMLVGLMLVMLHLALAHMRHQMLAAIVCALALAGPIGATVGRSMPRPALYPRRTRALAFGAVVLVMAAVRLAVPLAPRDNATAPVSAIDHLPPGLAEKPVLNAYGFGGYMTLRGIKPFIDGRAELFGDAFLARYRAITGQEDEALLKALEEYRVEWAILEPGTDAIKFLDRLPGWTRIYADKTAIVFTRTAPDAGAP